MPSILSLYDAVVREFRLSGPSLILVILFAAVQQALLAGLFFGIANLTGLGASMVRGDLLLYTMTGVVLFAMHIRTVSATSAACAAIGSAKIYRLGAVPQTLAAAIAALIEQSTAATLVVMLYSRIISEVPEYGSVHGAGSILAIWAFGYGLGLMFGSLQRASRRTGTFLLQNWARIGWLTSGGMFVANALPYHILPWLLWNPLFHGIDHTRGDLFINYTARATSPGTIYFAAAISVVIGLFTLQSWIIVGHRSGVPSIAESG